MSEIVGIYVLHMNRDGIDSQAPGGRVDNHSIYYPSFRKAESRLSSVFGDKHDFALLNQPEIGWLPDEADIDVLVIPDTASWQDIKFGQMWQQTHPDTLVMFNGRGWGIDGR